jgi:transcriptional regulator with XRE-family HTH domain
MCRMATRIEHVLALNVIRLREEHGWTQVEMARQMRLGGMNWSPNRVTQVETLRRSLTLLEVVVLAWVFGVAAGDLLAGDDDVALELDGRTAPLAEIRAAIEGKSDDYRDVEYRKALDAQDPDFEAYAVRGEELRRLGRRVGLDGQELGWVAVQLFGRDLFEERDSRVGSVAGLPPESVRSKRGHATRGVLTDVRAHIDGEGLDELRAQYQQAHAEALASARSRLVGKDER